MSVETVREYPKPKPTPQIRVDFSPHGEAFTFNVGEKAYAPANAYYGAVNSVITFTATAVFSDPLIQPVAYEWGFGDGTVGYGNPVTHEYAIGNTFTVHLAVIDNEGVAHRVTKTMYLK